MDPIPLMGSGSAQSIRSTSTISSRASAGVRPTRAMRRASPDSIRPRIHSDITLVFPHPRPVRTSQVSQSPSGGSCEGLAHSRHR